MTRTLTGWLGLLLLVCVSVGFAQNDSAMRNVQGSVSNPDESAAVGAVVQLKNMKTLQVRSFITLEDGTYLFFELSPDVDYELKADIRYIDVAVPIQSQSVFPVRLTVGSMQNGETSKQVAVQVHGLNARPKAVQNNNFVIVHRNLRWIVEHSRPGFSPELQSSTADIVPLLPHTLQQIAFQVKHENKMTRAVGKI